MRRTATHWEDWDLVLVGSLDGGDYRRGVPDALVPLLA